MYNVLIGTESFYDEGSSHLTTTIINTKDALAREEKYKDVVGFITKTPNAFESLKDFIIKEINKLNKNLVLIEHNDVRLAAQIYYKNKDLSFESKQIHVYSSNDINFDIWLKPEEHFWNPIDLLLEGGQDDLHTKINIIYDELINIKNKLNILGIKKTNL